MPAARIALAVFALAVFPHARAADPAPAAAQADRFEVEAATSLRRRASS